ncbi:MAG: HAD-IA family hydrolase [Paracoccaceae bacterium]
MPNRPLGPYQALLFDMDGTILTSIAAVERSWRAWAERVGVPPGAVLDYMHGRRAVDTIRHFLPPGSDPAPEVRWLDDLELDDLDGISAIPGALAFLEGLPPDRWAIVTSANRRLALARIAAAGLPLPAVLVSSDDVTRGKPDPQGYLRAAELLKVDPSRCLVLEDAPSGLRAGVAAGADVLRIAGTRGEDDEIPLVDTWLGYQAVGIKAAADGLHILRSRSAQAVLSARGSG